MQLAGAAWVLSNVALALFAWGLAERSLSTRPPLERALAAISGWVMGCSWIVLAVGGLNWLEPRAVLVACLTLGALGFPLWRSAWRTASVPSPGLRHSGALPVLAAGWALASACAFWLLRAILKPPQVTMDDAVYHGPAVAHWIMSRSLDPGDLSIHTTYPMTAELFAAFHVLPFGNDAWVAFTALGYAAVLTLAVLVLSRREDQDLGWPGVTAAAVVLASPVVLRAGASFAAVDVAVAAFLLSALAFLRGSASAGSRSPGSWGWAFAAAGFAVGVKPSAAPVVAAIFLILAWRLPRVFPTVSAKVSATLITLLGLFPMGFWYWRNLWETGNPVYPAPLFGLPGIADFGSSSIVDFLRAYPDLAHVTSAAEVLLDWPYPFAFASFLGGAWAVWNLVRGRSRSDLAVLVLGLVAVAWHPFSPFSSGNPLSLAAGTFHATAARYQIFGFAVGLALLARQLHGAQSRPIHWLGGAFAVVLVFSLPSMVRGAHFSLAISSILLGATGVIAWRLRAYLPRVGLVVGIGALVAAVGSSEWKVQQADTFAQRDVPRRRIGFAGWLAQEVEALPSGSRVSTVGLHSLRYPLLGRRYQHRIVEWTERPPTVDEVLASDVDWLFVGTAQGNTAFVQRLAASGRILRVAERPTDDRGLTVSLVRIR